MSTYFIKRLTLCGWLFLISCPALAMPDTKDIFNLKMRVAPRDTIRCGEEITVAIEFQNTTPGTLANFEVRAFFPNEIEKYCRLKEVVYATEKNVPVITDLGRNKFAHWQIGDLQAGKRDSIIFRLYVQWVPNNPVFFTYTATARAAGTSTSEVSVFNTFLPPCIGGPIPDIGIEKQTDRRTASIGDPVRFTLSLFNTSLDTAYNLTVEDTIPSGFTVDFLRISHPFVDQRRMPNGVQVIRWSFPGRFLPGARTTITIPTTVSLSPRIPTTLINYCEITSETPDGDYSNNQDSVWVTIVPKYDLRLAFLGEKEKTIAPNTAELYTLQITNRSTVKVENFNLTLSLNDGLTDDNLYTITEISDGGTAPDNVNINWLITALDSGKTVTRSTRLRYDRVGVGNPGKCVNFVAKVDTSFNVQGVVLPDLNPADNTDRWRRCLNDAFDLVLAPTPENNKPAVVINQTQSYKLEFTNQSLLTLPPFTLRALLQPTGSTLADQIKIANPSDGGMVAGLQINWTIPPMAPNSTGQRTFETTIAGINMEGTFGFTLTGEAQVIPGESNTANNRRTWETRATALPQLTLSDIRLEGTLASEEILTYAFTYGNAGNFPAHEATLKLALPVATAFLEWLDAEGQPLSHDDLGNGQRQVNLGDLSPGFQAASTVRVKVMKREDLWRSFSPGAAIDLKFEATLAASNVQSPVSKSRIDRLNVPPIVESFYLTRNTFRPEVHGNVELHFDVVRDAEVRFKIYNVAGELVRALGPVPGLIGSRVRQIWDGRNDGGSLVASGLYFVFAEVGYKSERPYRKLIVVR
jgi:uncharacterized repeat protein (TIGR01451 family)